MGQVCRRHEEFYEDNCRWCEPVSVCLGTMTGVAEPAAPAGTGCRYCPRPAAWLWTAISGAHKYHMCIACNADLMLRNAMRLDQYTREKLP